MAVIIDYRHPRSWPDFEKLKIRQAKYADAIRLALLERAIDICPRLAPTLAAPTLTPYPYRLLSYPILKTLHEALFWLIPYFANHTILENLAEVRFEPIPNWTKHSICEYLKIKRVIEPVQYGLYPDAWFKQTHNIINLLLYTVDDSQQIKTGNVVNYGIRTEQKTAKAHVGQGWSTGWYWAGSGYWSAGNSESLNEETDPYITEPMIGGERAVRLAEYVEEKFGSADWEPGGCMESNSNAYIAGGGGTGTDPEHGTAYKTTSRCFFFFKNTTNLIIPEFTVTIVTESGNRTITIPQTKPGQEYEKLLYTMHPFACEVNKPQSASYKIDFVDPFKNDSSEDEDGTVYRLVAYDFKFR